MLVANQLRQLVAVSFNPTRNSATRGRESACDIVVEATKRLRRGMNYDPLERIWKAQQDKGLLQDVGNELLDAFSGKSEKPTTFGVIW